MTTLCTICARANSKGLKNKNIKLLNGIPLIGHSVIQAVKSRIFDQILISSDCKKILSIGKKYGASCLVLRPKRLSSDSSGKLAVIKHAVIEAEKKLDDKFDTIIDLDVTSPLRNISDIKNAYKIFKQKNKTVLISASPAKKNPYFNQVIQTKNGVKLVKNRKKAILRRQDAPKVFDLNASIYVYKKQSLLKSNSIYTRGSILYIMPEERSIDIDNLNDFKYVEYLMKRKK
tara:strand:- start:423 stop:1115 length:693 start_codon:yes stop_codon:yes gene_type:complete